MIGLSVIICTFNRADLLAGCLESLTQQIARISDYEIIVVDNNSTDKTEEVVNSFVKQHSNFRCVKELKQGLSYARNRGYQEACGEYIAYIDDDAKADRCWVENIVAFTSKHPEILVFGGPYKRFSSVETPQWYKESYGSWSLGEEERPLRDNEWIHGTNMIYKRELLEEIGGFDVRIGMAGKTISYGEETNLLLKIRQKEYPIFYVPDIVVKHLVADYKLNLKWMLKSRYFNGFAALETFELPKRFFKQVIEVLYAGVKGVKDFIYSDEKYFETKLLDSFANFMWQLGLMMRMLK